MAPLKDTFPTLVSWSIPDQAAYRIKTILAADANVGIVFENRIRRGSVFVTGSSLPVPDLWIVATAPEDTLKPSQNTDIVTSTDIGIRWLTYEHEEDLADDEPTLATVVDLIHQALLNNEHLLIAGDPVGVQFSKTFLGMTGPQVGEFQRSRSSEAEGPAFLYTVKHTIETRTLTRRKL